MIPYARQEITDRDVSAVSHALLAAHVTQGPEVAAFEELLAATVGSRFAVACSSGTAALHAAYAAAGLGVGRGIVTSPVTFAATANAALYQGAPVRFADIDAETVQLDAEATRAAMEQDVAAIVPVYFGGHVARPEAYAAIAAEHGAMVIEDAAHALGATYLGSDGRKYRVGGCAHSAMCCFSFHAVKHITTGEGGAVTTNDAELAERLRRFRTHGITRDPAVLGRSDGPWYYEQLELGFNYRITDFQCALGQAQLRRLPEYVARRREIASWYTRALAALDGVRPVAIPEGSNGAYHLYVIRVASAHRRGLFEFLQQAGIGVNVHYIPVYRHPYYRAHGFRETHLPRAERYYAEAITLPMFPGLTEADLTEVIGALSRAIATRAS